MGELSFVKECFYIVNSFEIVDRCFTAIRRIDTLPNLVNLCLSLLIFHFVSYFFHHSLDHIVVSITKGHQILVRPQQQLVTTKTLFFKSNSLSFSIFLLFVSVFAIRPEFDVFREPANPTIQIIQYDNIA